MSNPVNAGQVERFQYLDDDPYYAESYWYRSFPSNVHKEPVQKRCDDIYRKSLEYIRNGFHDAHVASLRDLRDCKSVSDVTRTREYFNEFCKSIFQESLRYFEDAYNYIDFGSLQDVEEGDSPPYVELFSELSQQYFDHLTRLHTQVLKKTENSAVISPESSSISPQRRKRSDSSENIVDVSGKQKEHSLQDSINKDTDVSLSSSEEESTYCKKRKKHRSVSSCSLDTFEKLYKKRCEDLLCKGVVLSEEQEETRKNFEKRIIECSLAYPSDSEDEAPSEIASRLEEEGFDVYPNIVYLVLCTYNLDTPKKRIDFLESNR